MAEPTIGPNSDTQSDDHFNTVIYAGNNDATRTFDVGFVSDWSWFKARNQNGYGHQLYDSSRGVGKYLHSNATNVDVSNAEGVTSFNSSGNLAIGTDAFLNEDGTTMVIWNWKANGGTATATISESGDNPAAVVQTNQTAGFSIITYTGTGDAGTIAHGLGAVPKWIIIKNRDATDAWAVYHGENTVAPATDYLVLNTDAATADAATYWADTAPTSSVFTVHDAHNVNADGEKYVAYVFAEVKGHSSFGSYIGNGNADGAFVYTGFKPAWLMVKLISGGGENWHIFDNVRSPANVVISRLISDGNAAENNNDSILDFTSNGFKFRENNAGWNGSANTYIYMAFAEAPFKYANAR